MGIYNFEINKPFQLEYAEGEAIKTIEVKFKLLTSAIRAKILDIEATYSKKFTRLNKQHKKNIDEVNKENANLNDVSLVEGGTEDMDEILQDKIIDFNSQFSADIHEMATAKNMDIFLLITDLKNQDSEKDYAIAQIQEAVEFFRTTYKF